MNYDRAKDSMAGLEEDLMSFDALTVSSETRRVIPGQRMDYARLSTTFEATVVEGAPGRPSSRKPRPDDHFQWSETPREKISPESDDWMAGDALKKPGSAEDVKTREYMRQSSLKLGDHLSQDIDLCPWKQCVKYVNNYIGKRNQPRALPYFEEILEGRLWHFFYLHNVAIKHPAWLLVPTYQFVDFLDYINAALGADLCIPKHLVSLFRIKFGVTGPFRPRYLFSTDSSKAFTDKRPETKIPDEDREAFEKASPQEKDRIRQMLQRCVTRSPQAMRKQEDRAKDMASMLLDAQAMLGLRGAEDARQVVFVSIDFEALEKRTHLVSEIGIAVLDTRDIKGIHPGPSGKNWWGLIKAFHLRVKEFSGLRNHVFVKGCPDAFDFGKSTFPSRHETRKAILKVLKPWYGGGERRNLVVVGHNVPGDLKYLASVGVDVDRLGFIRQVDTMPIHQTWRKLTNGRSLDHVLADLGIPTKNLHNAGNDAVYTLRAVLGVAVESLRQEQMVKHGEEYVPALVAEAAAEKDAVFRAEDGEEETDPRANILGYVD